MPYISPYSIKPNRAMIRNFARRFGYTPMDRELSAVIGCAPSSIEHKMKHCNFKDHEKIAIAKEFELTAQEFVDMFYPDYFRPDGNIKLDREVKYKDVQERKFDIFPKYR